ncbi:VG15 protein [Nonomuraea aridisoli]|uniref:Phage head morphogenesis domain-containing protein n=1 Tax=Nonomuraea aridisoli TaxID=2070368 RepID=A0A2W2FG56_9ACTN|nr:hypothetical protein [Nonomuraea aridisoli]PZG20607.1 hypothetical protein C1J01_08880 [Nonomuraea aridisoli]
MTPEEYRRQQAGVLARLLQLLMPLLGVLQARPSDQQWRAFVQALYPIVMRSRTESWRAAERLYRGQRVLQGAPEGPIEFPRRNYPPEALDKALRRVARGRLAGLDDGQAVPELVRQEAAAVVVRHAQDAGREAIVDAARHDPEALGYARVATGTSTCAFCLMLVSRGPVYKSASAALLRDGTGEPYHDRCDCIAVPVFAREEWPGRAEYEAAERLWREGGRSLNGLRRYLAEQRRQSGEQGGEQAA